MNFAGGAVYTYYKFVDSQEEPGLSNSHGKDSELLVQNSRHSKPSANGHCVQQPADIPNGTANMV